VKFFCPQCGTPLEGDVKFCFNCGQDVTSYAQSKKEEEHKDTAVSVEETSATPDESVKEQPVENEASVEPASENAVQTVEKVAPTPAEQESGAESVIPVPVAETQQVEKETVPAVTPAPVYTENNKKGKKKKKKKLPWILRFIIANIIIAGVLFVLWFGFGNMLTLYYHSEGVLETLNSGSLELNGAQNAYDELPNYIKDMLDESKFGNEYGPITTSVLPYIKAERVKINGFFGASTVEYKITAPDLESWLLNLDPALITGEDALISMLQEYIKGAPVRSVTVKVKYNRKNLFSVDWHGNYYTREFADAVCGGFNSAYNVIYEKAMQEIYEAMYGIEVAQ